MITAHYNAAKSDAAVFRQDWMGLLKLTGQERQFWLQGMVTNEVEKLATGQGCYAAHLTAQGKLVAPMIVLVTSEEVWLLVERSAIEKLATAFDKLIIMEDVQVYDASEECELIGVIGPQSGAVLAAWAGGTIPKAPLYSHQLLPQGRVLVSDMGYDVIVRREESTEAIAGIVSAGAIQIGKDTWNVLRTEAGLPLYGVDIDETTTLPELGQRGISYDKGCYIGQEVVARIKYIGHVNRRFVGFVCEGSGTPEVPSVVRAQGREAGIMTTAVFSPELGKAIALGFVNRVAAETGTAVDLAGTASVTAAVVASLPLLPIRSAD